MDHIAGEDERQQCGNDTVIVLLCSQDMEQRSQAESERHHQASSAHLKQDEKQLLHLFALGFMGLED